MSSVTVDLDIQRWNLGAGESEVMHHSSVLSILLSVQGRR